MNYDQIGDGRSGISKVVRPKPFQLHRFPRPCYVYILCVMYVLYVLYVLCVLYVLYCYSINVIVPILLVSVVLYGDTFKLHCGGSPQPGDWFYNDRLPLGVYSYIYTITNADFSDDGEYQCRRNGVNVLGSPVEVIVYGECSLQVKDVVNVHVCEYKCEWM